MQNGFFHFFLKRFPVKSWCSNSEMPQSRPSSFSTDGSQYVLGGGAWRRGGVLVPLLDFHQCLDSISSARRLSFFRVSYPTTRSTDVGREERMRADSPLVTIPAPSSASSCLNVSMMDDRPSTFRRQEKSLWLGAPSLHRERLLRWKVLCTFADGAEEN